MCLDNDECCPYGGRRICRSPRARTAKPVLVTVAVCLHSVCTTRTCAYKSISAKHSRNEQTHTHTHGQLCCGESASSEDARNPWYPSLRESEILKSRQHLRQASLGYARWPTDHCYIVEHFGWVPATLEARFKLM